MKWIKFYSILGLILGLLSAIISLFVMDMLPILYKLYMGKEIVSSKMDLLLSIGTNIVSDLKIYSIFLVFTFLLMYFIKSVKQYLILLFSLIIIHFVFIAEIGELSVFRRLYQMMIMLPLLWIFFDYFRFRKENYEKKITNGFLYVTLLCVIFPGLYLPPFFNGIAGWTAKVNKTEYISVSEIYLVRNDGKEITYSRSIVSPINFSSRVNSYLLKSRPDKINKLLQFYQDVYIKRYQFLKEGKTPNQKYLGKISYPGHNPYGKFDYSEFSPNNIKEIKISTKYYTWEKKFINEKIIARKDWK